MSSQLRRLHDIAYDSDVSALLKGEGIPQGGREKYYPMLDEQIGILADALREIRDVLSEGNQEEQG